MVSMKSLLIERALVERRFVDLVVQLDVELHAAHAREVVLARVEEHALEQLGGGIERGRIAGTQLAVDLEQRVVLALHRVFPEGDGNHVAGIVAIGEEHLERRECRCPAACPMVDVSSWLASTSTSPVDMSITSAAMKAPCRSVRSISTCSILAF